MMARKDTLIGCYQQGTNTTKIRKIPAGVSDQNTRGLSPLDKKSYIKQDCIQEDNLRKP
jgi:hypothetical protein